MYKYCTVYNSLTHVLIACVRRACVRFRFLQRPEYMTPGTRFVFREGRTKGIGVVVGTEHSGGLVEVQEPATPAPAAAADDAVVAAA